MPSAVSIQPEVQCWRATSANVVFSYQFSSFHGKVVLASVKMLSEESPLAIMVKS